MQAKRPALTQYSAAPNAGIQACLSTLATQLLVLPCQVGHAVDGLKYAGGAFSVLSAQSVRALNDTAHQHGVYVSTGGWVEHVLGQVRSTTQDIGLAVQGAAKGDGWCGRSLVCIEASAGSGALPLRRGSGEHLSGLRGLRPPCLICRAKTWSSATWQSAGSWALTWWS